MTAADRIGRPGVVGLLVLALVTALAVVAPPARAASWTATLPTTGDVTVRAGEDVTLDGDLDLGVLRIAGTLRCPDDGSEVLLHVEAIQVQAGGQLLCGTPSEPFTGRLEVVLDGPTGVDHLGAGARSVVVEGLLQLHADDRGSARRELVTTAAAGATSIRLSSTEGLRAGDQLVVASTDFTDEHSERVTVSAVDGDRVSVSPALRYGHHCATEAYGSRSARVCGSVGVLTHDIVLRSPSGSIGGHVMAMRDGQLRLRGVELRHLGQLGRLGRYPIHWHMVGDGTGSWVRDSAVVDANNRFVTIHGTDGVEVTGTVGDRTVGHGFYTEDGAESGLVWRGNLGLRVRDAEPATAVTPSDTDASVYWVSNPDNTIVDNVAVGGWAGFWLAFGDRPVGLSAGEPDRPRTTPLRRFQGNTSVASLRAGVFVDKAETADRTTATTWYSPRVDPDDEDSEPVTPQLLDLTVAKSRGHAVWVRTRVGVEMRRMTVVDTASGVWTANVPRGEEAWSTLVDSIVVGESDNAGTAGRWEDTLADGRAAPQPWDLDEPLVGVHVYDGPMQVRDTTFARFATRADRRAAAISHPHPNPYTVSVRNRSTGLEFVAANRLWFGGAGPDGNDGTLLTDLDGTLTGNAGRVVTVRGALLDDASCTRRAAWNASVCPSARHARVLVIRDDRRPATVTATRTGDGRTVTVGDGDRSSSVTVRLDHAHRLSLAQATDPSRKLHLMVDERNRDGAVRLLLRHRGTPQVAFWDAPHTPAEADGPADLATRAQGWWHDESTGLLHLRLSGRGLTLHDADVPAGSSGGGSSGGGSSGSVSFSDTAGNTHAAAILWLARTGTTRGCNPPANTRFCPDQVVTRGQMAAFLTRALDLPAGRATFSDTRGHTFAAEIAALARADVTRGCNPPTNTRFCPDQPVTRAQMAAFLTRALDLPAGRATFADTRGHTFAGDIAALARADITRGCNPPTNSRFCPDQPVTRAQMATFLHRALG